MLQQVMTSPGKIEFREVPVPKAKKGQLVIKIMKMWIRYPCVPWKTSIYKISGNTGT